jgi:hypothetical protein
LGGEREVVVLFSIAQLDIFLFFKNVCDIHTISFIVKISENPLLFAINADCKSYVKLNVCHFVL